NRRSGDYRAEKVLPLTISQTREIDGAILTLNGVKEAGRIVCNAIALDLSYSQTVLRTCNQPVDSCICSCGVQTNAIKLNGCDMTLLIGCYINWHLSAVGVKLKLFRVGFRIEPCCEQVGTDHSVESLSFYRNLYCFLTSQRVYDVELIGSHQGQRRRQSYRSSNFRLSDSDLAQHSCGASCGWSAPDVFDRYGSVEGSVAVEVNVFNPVLSWAILGSRVPPTVRLARSKANPGVSNQGRSSDYLRIDLHSLVPIFSIDIEAQVVHL